MLQLPTGMSGRRVISGFSLAYEALYRVRFYHAYFRDGCARGLRLEPDAPSRERMSQYAMMIKEEGASFCMAVERAGLDRLQTDGGGFPLRFQVLADSPDYVMCTEGLDPARPAAYAWQAGRFVRGEAGDAVPAAVLMNCLMTLEIPLEGFLPTRTDGAAADVPLLDFLFTPKRTVWKYVLTGDWDAQPLRMVDMRGQIGFSAAGNAHLPSGEAAAVFLTDQPIALSEQYDFRFQLRGGAQDGERVLVARMPLASPRSFCKEMVNEEMTLVSEIFVCH